MAQRKALGRGLEALIPGADPSGVIQIRIEEIVPGTSQPRHAMNDSKLNELAASIRAHGVLLPILLRREGGRFEVVAGERRLRAARMAGLDAVPALVKELSGSQALEVALVENLQREDLNPIEAAEAYLRLQDEFGLTQEEVARRVGRDRSSSRTPCGYSSSQSRSRPIWLKAPCRKGTPEPCWGWSGGPTRSGCAMRRSAGACPCVPPKRWSDD